MSIPNAVPPVSQTATWRKAHLELSQQQALSESHQASGDLLVLTSSWERRCLEVSKVKHGAYDTGAVIRFAEEGTSGRRPEHDAILTGFVKEHSTKIVELEKRPTFAVEAWRDTITDLVSRVRIEKGRPIDIVVDVTCLPKYYMLTFLGFCIATGSVRSLKLFYAEGRYAPSDGFIALAPDHSFTDGLWRSLQVPFLEGRWFPDKKIEILASIGFETFQARKLIRLYEAERHTLITPYPGFSKEYGEQSEREAKSLANNLDLEEQEILRCGAGDAAAVAAEAVKVLDRGGRYKEVGLCMGTKPHAIGLGLAALVRTDFTLVCRIPDRYTETETPATGMTWSYELRDLSVGIA
jgi:hypothetical protein